MKITRNNYEIFFLDFYEGNLSGEKKNELFSFLKEHPDLKNEFENFEMVMLPPVNISYSDKNSLKKELITEENYQQYLIAKLEGDLNKEESMELDKFLLKHPELKKEEKLFAYTRLVADNAIVFPDKKKLKHPVPIRERNKKVFYYWAASAACILLMIGIYFLKNIGNEVLQANNETKKEMAPIKKNNGISEKENKNGGLTNHAEKSLTKNNLEIAANQKIKNHRKKNIVGKNVAERKKKKESKPFEIVELIARKEITRIEINEIPLQIATVNINLLKMELNNTAALNSYLDRVINADAKNNLNNKVNPVTNNLTAEKKQEKRPLLDFLAWGLSIFSRKDVMLKKSFNADGDLVAYQLEAGKFRIGKSFSR